MRQSESGLLFSPNDTSVEARQWWRRDDVQRALDLLQQPSPFFHGGSVVRLHDRSLTLHDLAFAFEIGLGPVKHPQKVPAGIGVEWYGIQTEQSVTDLATLHSLLWRVRPTLLIEIGTMCGSSAVVFAKMMSEYNHSAKLVTIDKTHPATRGAKCHAVNAGYGSPLWTSLRARGNLVSLVGDVLNATAGEGLRALLREEARRSGGPVFVIDDASHEAPTSKALFALLSPLVSVGSYYLIQDTRLDLDCALSFLTMPPGSVYWYCRRIQAIGGPARAVAELRTRDSEFRRAWRQDRGVERWVITQHPGGYLRRVRE